MKLTRPAVLRVGSAALSLLVVPHAARSDDLSSYVRRAVVRSAQIADQADSVWQQLAGEVVPAWQKPSALPAMTVPPPLLERAFADALLALPLEAAAKCSGGSVPSLTALVPGARQDAALLYQEQDDRAVRPLQNEPFYGALSKPGPAPAGVALRGFAPSLVTAAAAGDFSNSTLFGFEAYARWRVLQGVLSDDRPAEERRQLQRCFSETLGDEMLSGPLRGAKLPTPPPGNGSTARSEQTLLQAVDGCGALLDLMQANGLFAGYTLQKTMGSGTDLFDAGDWQAGGSTSWQFLTPTPNPSPNPNPILLLPLIRRAARRAGSTS